MLFAKNSVHPIVKASKFTAHSRHLWIGGPPKPHVTMYWPVIVYSLLWATMTIKGSLYLSTHTLKWFTAAKNCPITKQKPKWRFLEIWGC